jgi:hypothetical protein
MTPHVIGDPDLRKILLRHAQAADESRSTVLDAGSALPSETMDGPHLPVVVTATRAGGTKAV